MSTTQLILAFAITFVVGYIVGVLHIFIATKPPELMPRPFNVTDEQWQRATRNVREAAAQAARSAGDVKQWGDNDNNSHMG